MRLSSKFIKLAFIAGASSLAFGGCALFSSEEETHTIAIVKESVEDEYETTRCERRDVIKTSDISCTYSQLLEENLAFPVADKQVAFVYVNEGDEVKEGDLLAKLDVAQMEQDNITMRDQIARNELLIKQAEEMMELYQKKIESPDISLSSKENYLSKLQKLREKSRDYSDENEFDRIKISSNEQQIASGCLYAGMEGNISYIKDNLLGSYSNAGEKVITILNASVCGFQALDRNACEYMKVGDKVEIQLNLSDTKYDATVTAVDAEEAKIVFELDQPDYSLTVGTRGNITVVRGSAEKVLSLPKTCVFESEDFWFVYVINSDGVREMKKVTIGLVGNEYVEITGGLSEGESVILRQTY